MLNLSRFFTLAGVVGLIASLTLGCKAKRLTEPVRTQFYIACISSGATVTACMCLEKKGIALSGVTRIQPQGDDAKAQKFIEAVKASSQGCKEETVKEIANDIDEVSKIILDSTDGV